MMTFESISNRLRVLVLLLLSSLIPPFCQARSDKNDDNDSFPVRAQKEKFPIESKKESDPAFPPADKRIGDLGPKKPQPLYLASRKAPGPYHGEDPRDEIHDDDLPARAGMDAKHPNGENYPSLDPYNDSVRNTRKPYPAPNTPY